MPSIIDGLFASRSSIQAHGTAISVLADNIANQNTTGFKTARPEFADLLAGSLGGASGATTTGSGSSIIKITPLLAQGTFESTGRGLDAAIDGTGYFVVEDTQGNGAKYYTRAGNFSVDNDGFLLDQNGYRVLGFPAQGLGGLEGINVNQNTSTDIATAAVTVAGNLDASSDLDVVPSGTPTFADFNTAAQFSTVVDVFDSLGASHTVTFYYFHTQATPNGEWEIRAVVDGENITGETAGEAIVIGSATLEFDTSGERTAVGTPDFNATPAWSNGSTAGDIDFVFDPFTQLASSSNVRSITQDGSPAGSVNGFQIESDGTVFAQLDNGQTAFIGAMALAAFSNAESLERVGNALFKESIESGQPVIGQPDSGQFGAIEAGTLELSTTDIASDFIKLISYQRGFQGSSRIITNINDLLQELVNLA